MIIKYLKIYFYTKLNKAENNAKIKSPGKRCEPTYKGNCGFIGVEGLGFSSTFL